MRWGMGTPPKKARTEAQGPGSEAAVGQMLIDQILGFGF